MEYDIQTWILASKGTLLEKAVNLNKAYNLANSIAWQLISYSNKNKTFMKNNKGSWMQDIIDLTVLSLQLFVNLK